MKKKIFPLLLLLLFVGHNQQLLAAKKADRPSDGKTKIILGTIIAVPSACLAIGSFFYRMKLKKDISDLESKIQEATDETKKRKLIKSLKSKSNTIKLVNGGIWGGAALTVLGGIILGMGLIEKSEYDEFVKTEERDKPDGIDKPDEIDKEKEEERKKEEEADSLKEKARKIYSKLESKKYMLEQEIKALECLIERQNENVPESLKDLKEAQQKLKDLKRDSEKNKTKIEDIEGEIELYEAHYEDAKKLVAEDNPKAEEKIKAIETQIKELEPKLEQYKEIEKLVAEKNLDLLKTKVVEYEKDVDSYNEKIKKEEEKEIEKIYDEYRKSSSKRTGIQTNELNLRLKTTNLKNTIAINNAAILLAKKRIEGFNAFKETNPDDKKTLIQKQKDLINKNKVEINNAKTELKIIEPEQKKLDEKLKAFKTAEYYKQEIDNLYTKSKYPEKLISKYKKSVEYALKLLEK